MQWRVPLDKVVWFAKFDTAGGSRCSSLSSDSAYKRPTHTKPTSALPAPSRLDSRRFSDTAAWSAEQTLPPTKGRVRSASVSHDCRRIRNITYGGRESAQAWDRGGSGKTSVTAVVRKTSSSSAARSTSSTHAGTSWEGEENSATGPTAHNGRECSASTSCGSRGTQTKGHRGLSVDCVRLFANETWYKKGAHLMSAHATCLADDVMIGEGDDDGNDLETMCLRLSCPTASSRARQAELRPYLPPRPAARGSHFDTNHNNATTLVFNQERFTGSRPVSLHEMKAIVERLSRVATGEKLAQRIGGNTTLDFTSSNSTYWIGIGPFVE